MTTKYSITSLFSGCGGLDIGFLGNFTYLNKKYHALNFYTKFANDIDKNACLTFKKNLKKNIICNDINEILNKQNNAFTKTDVVIGGFPCQDFSYAGKRNGTKNIRGSLYKSMCKVIMITKPKIFLAENVKGLITIENGQTIKKIINDFKQLGYDVSYKLIKAYDFGIPQKRERVIILGTKKDILPPFDFEKIKPTYNKITVENAISDLEYLNEGDYPNHFWSKAKKNKGQGNKIILKNSISPTIRAEHHGNIEFHWNNTRRLSAREAARIQSFPDDFIFYPSTSSAYKQIGNAVPPVLGWHIAKAIQEFLQKNV